MPCRDYRDDTRTEYVQDPALKRELTKLKKRNDQLMRTVCALDALLFSKHPQYAEWLTANPEAAKVIADHRLADEENWYNVYHKQYPQFTKTEIARMVRAGILEDK